MKQVGKQYLTLTLALLISATLSTAFGQSPEKMAESVKLSEEALSQFMKGDFADAQESTLNALDINDRNYLARAIRGRIMYMENPESDKSWQFTLGPTAVTISEDPKSGAYVAFCALYQKRDLGLAHQYTQESLETAMRWLKNPKTAFEYYGRAIANIVFEKTDAAIADYTSAIKSDPTFVLAYRGRALLYNDKQQYDQALTDFNKAISLNPKFSLAYSSRGDAYFNKAAYDQAFADYTKAIELNPNNAKGYAGRGDVYRNRKQTDLAIAEYTKSIKADPDYSYAQYTLATVYHNAQQFDKAIEEYSKIKKPKSYYYADAHWNLGNIYQYIKKNSSEAFSNYNRAIETDPKNVQLYMERGNLWYKDKQYKYAVEDYTKALELDPDIIDAYSYRAAANLERQQDKFRYAIGIQGTNFKHNAPEAYADAREFGALAQADYSQAIDICTKAISKNPNDAENYFKRGGLYLDQKQFDMAIADYTAMIKLSPQAASAYYNRAIAYYAFGRDELAAADRQQYKKLGGTLSTDVGKGKRYLYPDMPFDEKTAKVAISGGTATIEGKALTKAAWGLRKYKADNALVTLIPATPYIDAWYTLQKKEENKKVSVQMSAAALKFSLETMTDDNGNFQFTGLKPGRYYIYARNIYATSITQQVDRGSDWYTNETGGRTIVNYYDWETRVFDHDDLLEEFVEIKKDGESVKFTLNKKSAGGF